MTDKEKLCELLTSFGVEWREKPEGIKCGGYHEYYLPRIEISR